MTSFIVLLSTFSVAYAFDVGGIQSKLEVWFRGEKRNVQYKEEDKNACLYASLFFIVPVLLKLFF